VAVARLRAAGAALIGRTNMSEFAYSGVGVNPHHGTPANAVATDVPRVPGGSSSGAAVSVATGSAFVGLGSDTGGSIRIPAALQGLVGFKSTQRLVPLDGTVPLSSTLDTACAITRSVRDAITVHEILAARRVTRSHAPLSAYRLAVVPQVMFDGIDATVARAFDRTLQALRTAGARIENSPAPLANWRGCRPAAALPPPRATPGTAACWPTMPPSTTHAFCRASSAAAPSAQPTTSICCKRDAAGSRASSRPWPVSTRCSRRPCPSSRPRWPTCCRAARATKPSSASTACCCATPAW
jgi:Asp-tRNA(Asn)/Glu-tRNA(Gln) amidotransferase A subunit family amidase